MSKQSLVSQSIPAALAPSDMTVQDTFETTPYVAFCSTKSPKFASWAAKAPGLQDGDPVLFEGDDLTALSPMRFFLMQARQWWGETTDRGEILRSTFDVEMAKEDREHLKENVETILLVVLPTRVQVARCTFKGPKCSAAKTAMNAHADATDADWGSKSDDHKRSLCAPDTRFRYTTVVSLRTRTSRSGKGAGRPYVQASGIVQPITVSEMTLLTDFFNDTDNHAICDQVVARHNDRMKNIEAKNV